MNILCIAAHPDDEVLGCGGTLARMAMEGDRVHILIVGEGCTSREELSEEESRKGVEMLRRQAEKAGQALGASGVEMLGLPDNRLDSLPLLEIVKLIEHAMAKYHPEVVFTHFFGDVNVDHSIIHRAVLTASRPKAGQTIKELYAFEIPSSTEWAFGQLAGSFQPCVYWDISDTLEHKILALMEYEDEIFPFPHPRSPQTIRAGASLRGSCVGLTAAEGFIPVRIIR